jgi:hypothetical protein
VITLAEGIRYLISGTPRCTRTTSPPAVEVDRPPDLESSQDGIDAAAGLCHMSNTSSLANMGCDLSRSRTLAFSCATIPDPARTTCTRSTGRCRERTRWNRSTLTWPPAIAHDSGLSTYVPREALDLRRMLTTGLRFSEWSSLRRRTTSSGHTSSSSCPRTWRSPCRTASPSPPARRSSAQSDRPLSRKGSHFAMAVSGRSEVFITVMEISMHWLHRVSSKSIKN